ncbi:MAG: META domain-containing protein [Allosphingosinicella sp.]
MAIALSGCAPADGPPAPPPTPTVPAAVPASGPDEVYLVEGATAAGGAPGWRAVIDRDRILLRSPTSAGWYVEPRPEPRIAGLTLTFATPRLTLLVDADACALRDRSRGLTDRIVLDWDGGRFEGCGGDRPPATAIAGTVWELVRLGAEAAPAARSPAATLTFAPDGRLGGTLACNDGGLATKWTPGGGFVRRPDGFVSTQMGCGEPAAEAFGARFWQGLAGARSWRREGERLMVTLADRTEAELRRLI